MIQFTKAEINEEVSTIEPITIIYKRQQKPTPMNKLRQHLNICVPGPFPFQSIKVVPWRYETTAYVGGKAIQFFE